MIADELMRVLNAGETHRGSIVARRCDHESRSLITNDRSFALIDRDAQASVEVKKEFKEVMTFAGEDVFDCPTTFALVERDDAAMSDRRGKSMIGVVLGVQEIVLGIALPRIHLSTGILSKRE